MEHINAGLRCHLHSFGSWTYHLAPSKNSVCEARLQPQKQEVTQNWFHKTLRYFAWFRIDLKWLIHREWGGRRASERG